MSLEKEFEIYGGHRVWIKGFIWLLLFVSCFIYGLHSHETVLTLISIVLSYFSFKSLYEYFTKKAVIILDSKGMKIVEGQFFLWKDIVSIQTKIGVRFDPVWSYNSYLEITTKKQKYPVTITGYHMKSLDIAKKVKCFWELYRGVR